ncbi:MAG TPA: CDGSH iron-sulfur domain-containing protein [Myxococcales bacterium]|nr:CDGSH iron-sulfur domain-containing protein [Myxococcales bacterium]HIN86991.1 CDGSH iron-sulfur domain-containing protein [Myxococcales bacterium]
MEPTKTSDSSNDKDRRKPFVVEEKKGIRALCLCDLSRDMPYCDGSHSGTGKMPSLVKLTQDETVSWCGCGKSENFPYCDGTHETL